MNSMLVAANAVLPIAFMMFLGAFLKSRKIVRDNELHIRIFRHAVFVPVLAEQIDREVLADIDITLVVGALGFAVRFFKQLFPRSNDIVDKGIPGCRIGRFGRFVQPSCFGIVIKRNLFLLEVRRESVFRQDGGGEEKEQETQDRKEQRETGPKLHLTVSPSISMPETVICFGICVSGFSIASMIRVNTSLAI